MVLRHLDQVHAAASSIRTLGLGVWRSVVSVPAPGNMARVATEASAGKPGNWLVSLAFELPGVRPSMRTRSPLRAMGCGCTACHYCNGWRRAGWRAVGGPINVVATQGKALIFCPLRAGSGPSFTDP